MSAAFTPGPWRVDKFKPLDVIAGDDYLERTFVAFAGRGTDIPSEANARLIAAAPDHALIGWAMCVQDATWHELGADGKGEFCFAGLRHCTWLDQFGCPILTANLRDRLAHAYADWQSRTVPA